MITYSWQILQFWSLNGILIYLLNLCIDLLGKKIYNDIDLLGKQF